MTVLAVLWLVAAAFLVGCASAPAAPNATFTPAPPTATPAPKPFIIEDLVPSVNFSQSTKSRFLVTTNQAGRLELEVRFPSHRQEIIFGGSRVTLGGGKGSFGPPPQSLEQQAPRPGFAAGMVTPDWFAGAEHIIIGKISVEAFVFDSDPTYPLVFKVVKDIGYVYLCGRGTVTTPRGKSDELGKGDTADSWIRRSSSDSQLDREGAAQALGYLAVGGSESSRQRSTERLTEMLRDKAFEVRRDAVESLALVGTSSAGPVLSEIAEKDENEWVQATAKWAFGKLEGK